MSTFNGNRIVISGTNSGSGKTTVTCAILKCLQKKGLNITAYKCGPDYIDPMFHRNITNIPTLNLDNFFCDENTIKNIFATNSKNTDISVIEGVMGYYDGLAFDSAECSTYRIADILNANTVLVINARGMAYSVNAIICGFLSLKENSHIKGIIFNNITEKTYEQIKLSVEKTFPQCKCLGYLPSLPKELIIESRYLGLITANEITELNQKMDKLCEIAHTTLDIDGIYSLSKDSDSFLYEENTTSYEKIDVNVAVARDNVFCFYYEENIQVLKNFGANIKYFSPLADKTLPNDIDAIYIGGGYPELYKEKLSQNKTMLESIKNALSNKIPCIAECGGFMYLNKEIESVSQVGFFGGICENNKRLVNFGYKNIVSLNDNLLLNIDESIKGHEFHYYNCSDVGNDCICRKNSGLENRAIFANDHIFAGFPHLYFASNTNAIRKFMYKAKEYKNGVKK